MYRICMHAPRSRSLLISEPEIMHLSLTTIDDACSFVCVGLLLSRAPLPSPLITTHSATVEKARLVRTE